MLSAISEICHSPSSTDGDHGRSHQLVSYMQFKRTAFHIEDPWLKPSISSSRYLVGYAVVPCDASSLINGFRMHETTGSCGYYKRPRIRLLRSVRPNVVSATRARWAACGSCISGDRQHESPTPRALYVKLDRHGYLLFKAPTGDRLARPQARTSFARIGRCGSGASQALDGLLQVVTHDDEGQIRVSRFGWSARYWCFFLLRFRTFSKWLITYRRYLIGAEPTNTSAVYGPCTE